MCAVQRVVRCGAGADDGHRGPVAERLAAQVYRTHPAQCLKALGQLIRGQHGGDHKGEAISYPSLGRQVQATPSKRFQRLGEPPGVISSLYTGRARSPWGVRCPIQVYRLACIITRSPMFISWTDRVTSPTEIRSPTSTITICPSARAGNWRSS